MEPWLVGKIAVAERARWEGVFVRESLALYLISALVKIRYALAYDSESLRQLSHSSEATRMKSTFVAKYQL
jgi:hypothetical protein